MVLRGFGWLRALFLLPLFPLLCPAALGSDLTEWREQPLVAPSAPGELIVQFDEALTQKARQTLLRQLGARVKRHGYRGAFEVVSTAEGGPFQAALVRLRRIRGIRSVEPNYYVSASEVNDPYFKPYQWNFADAGFGIRAETAWKYSNGSGVTVAVVDTGIAYENYGGLTAAPDFATTRFVPGYDFVKDDAHPQDRHGHGTHVAGVIAESTDNGIGCAGIAYGASIMPIRVLDDTGNGTMDQVASGVRWAVDHGAQVINLSLGGPTGSAALASAVEYAASKNVLLVGAAGNDGSSTVQYPAAYPGVIAVGATRLDGQLAAYSSYGPRLDVVAPGGDLAMDQNGDGLPDGILQQRPLSNSLTSFGYYFASGTSVATPHVSAVAALVRSRHPSWTAAEVTDAIEKTCRDLGAAGKDTTYGYGLVDAAAAVQYSPTDTTPPPAPTGLRIVSAAPNSVALAWDAATGDAGVTGYRVYRNGAPIASASGTAFTDDKCDPATPYRYAVTAYDATGNASAFSAEVAVTTPAPDIAAMAAPGFGFEDGTLQGWLSGTSRAGVANSTTLAYEGQRSLRIALNSVSSRSRGIVLVRLPSGTAAPTGGNTVRARVYLPRSFALQARVAVYDAAARIFYGSYTYLSPNTWTELSVAVPTSAIGAVSRIELQVGGPFGSFTGDLYLDAVSW